MVGHENGFVLASPEVPSTWDAIETKFMPCQTVRNAARIGKVAKARQQFEAP